MLFNTGRTTHSRAVVAVLCCGRTLDGRGYQVVADRYMAPIARAGGMTLVVPSLPEVIEAREVALRCDALLMTGSCSNVSPARYGCSSPPVDPDAGRDEVALRVADAMISAGKPVLGICRGFQEINALLGGTITFLPDDGLHVGGPDWSDPSIFAHRHEVIIEEGGVLGALAPERHVSIVSAHRQGVSRLASGVRVEARAPDGLVEAFSMSDRSSVVGVQWHPELGESMLDRSLFENLVLAA